MAWNQGEFQLSAQFGTREVETHTLLCERIWNVSKLGQARVQGVLAVVFGRFLGVLILVPGRYLKRFVPGLSFLVFGSWALLVLGIAGPGRC
jgi:hypothetical protein